MLKAPPYYILLIVILFVLQAVFTFNSMNQIRYEELAESVRNPFWFHNRLMYDGLSGSISWYGLQALIYNIFGFHLYTAKFIRLALYLVSLLCLASILKKHLGKKIAWLPLLTIGLSPTILYFNTLQTTYGIDLQLLPIILWLFQKNVLVMSGAWFLAMIAWLAYPTFIFYLPLLAILYLRHFFNSWKKLLLSMTLFILPLILTFIYIENTKSLINDPVSGSGLFRGGVRSGIDLAIFFPSLQITLSDLFIKANSYYFEAYKVEFSDYYPLISVILVIYLSIYLYFKKTKFRFALNLTYLLFILGLIVPHITGGDFNFAGIRRATPILASFYALFCLGLKIGKLKKWLFLIMLILPVHHILVYPANLAHIKDLSPYREKLWFEIEKNPQDSLKKFVDQVQKSDLTLACKDQTGQTVSCRYSEIYAGVAGSCLWNRLECHNILGLNQNSKKIIPLSVDLWNSYQLGH